ncbi:MAG: hypothetical protein J6T54_09390 [Fibrobacter sp.]|nr:hypothetical protein [Fibrobacter sp.]
MDVTKERIDAAIDLLTTMVVEDIAKERGQDPSEVLPEFLLSRTGQMLLNKKNKLWWEGPSAIEEMFKKEQNI